MDVSFFAMLLQGGSFALVVYIVVWAYPQAMKDQREERERRDDRFEEIISTMHEKFSERNDGIVRAVERQTRDFSSMIKSQTTAVTNAIVCNYKAAP